MCETRKNFVRQIIQVLKLKPNHCITLIQLARKLLQIKHSPPRELNDLACPCCYLQSKPVFVKVQDEILVPMKKYAFLPLSLLTLSFVAPVKAAPTTVKLGPHWSKEISSIFTTLKRSGPVDYFSKKPFSDTDLIGYGIADAEGVNGNRFRVNSNDKFSYRIPGKYVSDFAMRYFGRSIKPKATSDVVYKNGYFWTQGSDAMLIGDVTADKLLKIKPDVYEVHLSWHLGEDYGDQSAKIYLREKATLKRTAKGGKSRFIVTSYAKVAEYNVG